MTEEAKAAGQVVEGKLWAAYFTHDELQDEGERDRLIKQTEIDIDAAFAEVVKERDDYKKALGELMVAGHEYHKAILKRIDSKEFSDLFRKTGDRWANAMGAAEKLLTDHAQEKREDKKPNG